VILVALVALPSAPAAARPETQTATSGNVTATVSYDRRDSRYRDVRLAVTRAGVLVHDDAVKPPCRGCPVILAYPPPRRSVAVRDLDRDSEPEVLLDLYTGGAHCCEFTEIRRFLPQGPAYARSVHEWGNVGYRLRDIGGDGLVELVSADDRFAFAFTSYADSGFPIRIWRFDDGRLRDLTRRFRREVGRDARRWQRAYRRSLRQRQDVRGVLAAYVADQYLLGRPSRGWAVIRRAHRRGRLRDPYGSDSPPSGRRYIRALRRFLRRTGYAR